MFEEQKKLVDFIMRDIRSSGRKKVIVDTDAFNELDDQYAITYALCAEKTIDVLAVCAAPFYNDNSSSFADGTVKSYEEIKRIARGFDRTFPVCMGSMRRMSEHEGEAERSEASDMIVKCARETDGVLYILALGAITNVANAVLTAPDITEKICVIWLAGCSLGLDRLAEFNLCGDYRAGQIMMESTAPILLCPAWNVTCVLTAPYELLVSMRGVGRYGTYLADLAEKHCASNGIPSPEWRRIIWDIAAPAILDNPDCAVFEAVEAPVFADGVKYEYPKNRHHIIELKAIERDMTFGGCLKAMRDYAEAHNA